MTKELSSNSIIHVIFFHVLHFIKHGIMLVHRNIEKLSQNLAMRMVRVLTFFQISFVGTSFLNTNVHKKCLLMGCHLYDKMLKISRTRSHPPLVSLKKPPFVLFSIQLFFQHIDRSVFNEEPCLCMFCQNKKERCTYQQLL